MAKQKAKWNRGALLVIAFLLVLGIVGLYFGILYPRLNAGYTNTRTLNIPMIQVPLISDDGKTHDVQVKFSIEIDNSLVGRISSTELHGYLTEIVATLDYEQINGPNSIDYIKEEAKQQLGNYIDDDDKLQRIYITHVLTGDNLTPVTEESGRDKMFKQLFPGIQ